MNNSEKKIAVLIDADNAPSKYIVELLQETSQYGVLTIKRIYGDWTKPQLSSWKETLLAQSITPIQQFGYTTGKNATDSSMIIDAMDILYSGMVEGFCLVTSDSDFTRLASRLREAGMLVIGMGERKTPQPFIAACAKFIYLEILKEGGSIGIQIPQPTSIYNHPKVSDEVINKLKSVIINEADESGWAYLGEVGNAIIKIQPDFDPRNYGFLKLRYLIESISIFEVELRLPPNNSPAKTAYVKVK